MKLFMTGEAAADVNGVVVEDCIMQRGKLASAGSRMLYNFKAPFDATVVEKLEQSGINIAGRCKMAEFGIDMVSDDCRRSPAGAVAAVSGQFAGAALCNDFSGQIRRQAPQNGVCYIHPTYGTVSRYGLIPSVCSMDQIGVVCKDMQKGFEILAVIAGHDQRDGAMLPGKAYEYRTRVDTAAEGRAQAGAASAVKLALPQNVLNSIDRTARETVQAFAGSFATTEIELPFYEVYSQVMYILSSAEISNNMNRYDGIKFGYRTDNYKSLNDLYVNSRTEGLGRETKLASIIGAFVLSQDQYVPYYEKAMKIRRLIKEALKFDTYDVIALPAHSEADAWQQSALYALAALAGLPSVSFPCQGGGVQLIADVGKENMLLTAWEVTKG